MKGECISLILDNMATTVTTAVLPTEWLLFNRCDFMKYMYTTYTQKSIAPSSTITTVVIDVPSTTSTVKVQHTL